MTLTFENENDVLVFALEKIICYARKNQYIFVAQSVWWIASVIGLADGLATHIDNLRSKAYRTPVREFEQALIEKEAVVLPRDPQANSGDISEASNLQLDHIEQVIADTEEFIINSKKQRKEFKKKPDPLTRTRSGKIPVKPLTQKQRNRLQAIPKDTLVAFLKNRK